MLFRSLRKKALCVANGVMVDTRARTPLQGCLLASGLTGPYQNLSPTGAWPPVLPMWPSKPVRRVTSHSHKGPTPTVAPPRPGPGHPRSPQPSHDPGACSTGRAPLDHRRAARGVAPEAPLMVRTAACTGSLCLPPRGRRPSCCLCIGRRRLWVRHAHASSAGPSALWLLTSAPCLRLSRCFHFLAQKWHLLLDRKSVV